MTVDVRRARTASLWVGVIVPVAILVLSASVVVAWLPELPDPAATHWGVSGVDGFGPAWIYPVLLLGIGALMIGLFAVVALPGGRTSPTARFLAATSLAVSTMMAALTLLSVGVQRGLADAADAPDITGWVMLGLVVMAGVGVLGWFAQPTVSAESDAGESAAPLDLGGSERAVWMRTASTARAGQIVLGIAVLLVFAMTALLAASGSEDWWAPGIVAIVLTVLVATMLVFRVRASADGLAVRSVIGWPRFSIPAANIVSVRVVDVSPFAEFGGWGYRFGLDGRRGIVLRAGEALQVEQRSGKTFVVTVDDARTAAAVLAAASGQEPSA